MVAGRLFHTGTSIVLWTEPGGYDAYRTEYRFRPVDQSDWKPGGGAETPNRYGTRKAGLSPAELEQIRGGGWTLDLLRRQVDQFVLHYDATGRSRTTFQVLHDERGLSAHFLLDLDGTIYQTLDLKERAWHATKANDRAVGIEIANIGAVPLAKGKPGWPSGVINGKALSQPPYTEAQYAALIRLTAALCDIFPNLPDTYPTDASGKLITHTLSDAQFAGYHGLLGHFHVQTNKVDPGPAFDWDRLKAGAAALLR